MLFITTYLIWFFFFLGQWLVASLIEGVKLTETLFIGCFRSKWP